MITLAIALADKWNNQMGGFAYLIAIIADCYIMTAIFGCTP